MRTLLEDAVKWELKQDSADVQDGHSKGEPEVLLTNNMKTIWIPVMGVEIVAVAQYDKDPSWMLCERQFKRRKIIANVLDISPNLKGLLLFRAVVVISVSIGLTIP